MFWSGGKDSALALNRIQQRNDISVDKLITCFSGSSNRVSIHGVSPKLIERQAEAIGIPLEKIEIPENCSMEKYQELASDRLKENKGEYEAVVFGDIFLEEAREKRKETMADVALEAVLPIWGEDTEELIQEFIEPGFKARTVCVDEELGEVFAGRRVDREFVKELPEKVDSCGENGEFHSFVTDGPIFDEKVEVKVGEKLIREIEGKVKHYINLDLS